MVQLRLKQLIFILILSILPLQLAAQTGGDSPVEIRFDIPAGSEISPAILRRQAGDTLKRLAAGEGSPAGLADSAYAMRTWLIESGRPEAQITAGVYAVTPEGRRELNSSQEWQQTDLIVFTVRPGELVYIGQAAISGNSAFSDDRLKAFLNLGEDAPYVKQTIEAGVGRISRFYALNGFARFKMEPVSTVRRSTDSGIYYDIEIRLQEGPRFRIEKVDIQGEGLGSDELTRLHSSLDLLGKPYYPRMVSEGALTISRELGRSGYDPSIDRSRELGDDGSVIVRYQVEKGPRLIIDSVEVVNTGSKTLRSRHAFILSFFPLMPGDTVDFTTLNRVESRLYSLGMFAFVNIDTRVLSESGDPRPVKVLISVEELSSQYLELEAGWNSYELLRGSATFIDRNLFGLGRRFSFSLHGSFKTYGAETSISDTLLLGPGSTTTLTGSYRYRESPSFSLTTIGGELSVAYQFDPAFSVSSAYEYTRSLTDDVKGEIAETEEHDLSTGRLKLSTVYDTRNSIVFPLRGEYLQTSLFLAPEMLGSDIGFYGGHAVARLHFTAFNRLTLSTAGDYRFRRRFISSDSLPIQERLFLGGSNSVRAFGQDQLGQVNPAGISLGGMSSLKATAELRMRLMGALYAALFYDAGLLSPEPFSLSGDFGHGPGAGVQYNLPIGPIRFDLAYNPGELYAAGSRWVFHFGIGLSY